MSGDYLAKVQSGQSLNIPASAWNTMIDMARAWLANGKTFNSANTRLGGTNKILIKNSSGSNVDRFAILGIDGVILDPATAPDEFKNKIIFDGNTPSSTTHADGKFAITAEPIINGEYGYAYSGGVCHCQINVTNESHSFADVADSDSEKLNSAESGNAIILYKETGTGTKWAIIRFGGGGGGTQVRRAKIQTSGVGTTTLSCKLLDSAGTETGDAITVYPVEHLGTNNLSGDVWPKLAAADIVSIFQDVNDTWYTTFIFDDVESC